MAKKSQGTEKTKPASAGSVASGGLGGKVAEFKDFFEESKVEIKKVTWPSRKETVTTSIAVLAVVVVMSLFLGIVDLGLSKLIAFILS